MKQTKMNSAWYFAVFVALLGLSPIAQVASAQTKVPISHIVISPIQVPLWIAHEQGLFTKQGIDAQLIHTADQGQACIRILLKNPPYPFFRFFDLGR